MDRINLKTVKRIELVDITDKIQSIISKSKIGDGLCVIFCPHTTAGLTINENADPSVRKDISEAVNKIVPLDANYAHAEGNSDSHVKSSLFGSSLSLFVQEGKLMLGSWQGIYFCEGDGPRSRELWVKVVKE
jgi:secondary thiamine-phosphate synthase enzyme